MYRPTVSNGKITGYAIEFADSDACVECHGGTEAENKTNALKFEAAQEMYEALETIEAAFRMAEKSTPANLRRAIAMAGREALNKTGRRNRFIETAPESLNALGYPGPLNSSGPQEPKP